MTQRSVPPLWLRIAAKGASTTRVETLADSGVDPIVWLRERAAAFCSEGLRGPLYIFLRQALTRELAEALQRLASDRRAEPVLVATGTALASDAQLALLRQTGLRSLYVTLYGSTAAVHDGRTSEAGSWKRALAVLTLAPRILDRVRVGVHFRLAADSADELPRVLQLARRVNCAELLLWDGAVDDAGDARLESPAALSRLDLAVNLGQKLRLRIRPVGFERTRTAVTSTEQTCALSGAVAELLQDGIPLPSARYGVLATVGESAAIAEVAPSGRAVSQLAFELAAGGTPVLDLPACLGGPPPPSNSAVSARFKVDACRLCPIESRCAGVPAALAKIPGLRDEVQPPRHWLEMPAHLRVLVLCPIVSDVVYGATFFSLARALAGLGAVVDVVSPWAVHERISPSFSEVQPFQSPDGTSAIDAFVSSRHLEEYDLIVTRDLPSAHPLVLNRRLRADARLVVNDFHMLGGMNEWVRDFCAAGQRPEEGGWWPSDQILLFSAFPGYARLYNRYGVPMRQIVWQPFALDPAQFPYEQAASAGELIVSAGHHLRDLDTFLAAATRLGSAVRTIDLFSKGEPRVPPNVRFQGTVATSVFCEAVSRSRFTIVPLLEEPNNAAGVTAVATSFIYGRPVVATATTATRDYVVEGVNGLLVPAGDAEALAEAIERLDTDASLLEQLAVGAERAGAQLTTESWARALLQGSRSAEADHWMWNKWQARKR
ncbi:MAG: glycosyltransferase [Deltaproteobacteria bacterium]|nr:glycosyltransferase [Deltaproteobacteria bacterium]